MKTKKILLAVAAVIAIIGIVAFTTAGSDKSMDSMNMTDKAASSDTTMASADKISIKNYMYGPMNTTVKVGTTVTWTNEDAVAHTVTAETKMEGAPDSMDIPQNGTYSFTFTKAGTYNYYCVPHPYMKATVTVTE